MTDQDTESSYWWSLYLASGMFIAGWCMCFAGYMVQSRVLMGASLVGLTVAIQGIGPLVMAVKLRKDR